MGVSAKVRYLHGLCAGVSSYPANIRRHYGITLSEKGAEMHVVQAMLGHASVTTTEKHYAHFSPRFASRRALQVLEGRKQAKDGTQLGRRNQTADVGDS